MEIRYNVGGYSLTGRSVNISAGGLFMDTDALAPVGTELVIYTKMPTAFGTFPIEIRGKIVRIANGGSYRGVGIAFQGVHTDETETTNQLVREIFGSTESGGADPPAGGDSPRKTQFGFSPHRCLFFRRRIGGNTPGGDCRRHRPLSLIPVRISRARQRRAVLPDGPSSSISCRA